GGREGDQMLRVRRGHRQLDGQDAKNQCTRCKIFGEESRCQEGSSKKSCAKEESRNQKSCKEKSPCKEACNIVPEREEKGSQEKKQEIGNKKSGRESRLFISPDRSPP